ncbi:hypothetical protein PM082_004635 [Marasmius tenuissimus]|nr:hypothetical protein PM082_004635 [Marasmius tenuissimus]
MAQIQRQRLNYRVGVVEDLSQWLCFLDNARKKDDRNDISATQDFWNILKFVRQDQVDFVEDLEQFQATDRWRWDSDVSKKERESRWTACNKRNLKDIIRYRILHSTQAQCLRMLCPMLFERRS